MTDQNNQAPAQEDLAPQPINQAAGEQPKQAAYNPAEQGKLPKNKELTRHSDHMHKEVKAHGLIHAFGVVAAVLGVLTIAGTSGFILYSMLAR